MKQHQLIIASARDLNLRFQDISHLFHSPVVIVENENHEEIFQNGVPGSPINLRSELYCDHKQLTKIALRKLNIPAPESFYFQIDDYQQCEQLMKQQNSYVCKPVTGTNGIGVQKGIRNQSELQQYLTQNKSIAEHWILEEEVTGQDLRLQVVGKKIVAACIRKPAFVIGNGTATLQELIDQFRKKVQANNPLNNMIINADTRQLLKKQSVELNEIIADGREIQLKSIANMAQGAIAYDVSNEIHPNYSHWVHSISEFLQCDYFGLDVITTNHIADPDSSAKVLEINAKADWLHHTFSENRTHYMSHIILKSIFSLP